MEVSLPSPEAGLPDSSGSCYRCYSHGEKIKEPNVVSTMNEMAEYFGVALYQALVAGWNELKKFPSPDNSSFRLLKPSRKL